MWAARCIVDSMDDIKYSVAFSRIPSIGTVRMRLLESAFSSMHEAWEAPASALKAAGLTANALQQVTSRRPSIDPDREMELLELAGVRSLSWHDDDYPAALKEIYDPPPVLFSKGGFAPEDVCGVAVRGHAPRLGLRTRGLPYAGPRPGSGGRYDH